MYSQISDIAIMYASSLIRKVHHDIYGYVTALGDVALLAQDGGEISWYFQVGEVMKEVNAFFGM